jgi:hypothetical protein
LAMYVVPVDGLRKRQTYNTPALIGSGGVSASCANADRFYVSGGRLYDAGLLVSADRNVPTAAFVGSTRPGPIRGSFAIRNNVLSWSNAAFADGEAQFCVSGQDVLAVFDGELPSGCVEVTVMAVKYCKHHPVSSSSTINANMTISRPLRRRKPLDIIPAHPLANGIVLRSRAGKDSPPSSGSDCRPGLPSQPRSLQVCYALLRRGSWVHCS